MNAPAAQQENILKTIILAALNVMLESTLQKLRATAPPAAEENTSIQLDLLMKAHAPSVQQASTPLTMAANASLVHLAMSSHIPELSQRTSVPSAPPAATRTRSSMDVMSALMERLRTQDHTLRRIATSVELASTRLENLAA